jgi:hypothetical protein
MLNSGGKKSRFVRQKKMNVPTFCPEKKFWTKQKTITPPPPLQVKWSKADLIVYQI